VYVAVEVEGEVLGAGEARRLTRRQRQAGRRMRRSAPSRRRERAEAADEGAAL
jgi:hypothetical protein